MYFSKKKYGLLFKKFSFVLCLCLVLNCIFVPRVYAADAATYRTGLAPLETLVAAVVIGSGIVAGQSQQAVDALVSSVSKIIKDNTVRKAEQNPAFESPYRVIQGGGGSGSDPTPEEPNNNNKNGRWFGVVGASSLGSALLFEKGAVEEIMQTIKGQNGYDSMYSPLGVVSASDLLTTSSASNISLQLANISNLAVKQFDDFLHSNWWSDNNISPNDCLFSATVRADDVGRSYYPELNVIVMVNDGTVKNIRLTGNPFVNRIISSSSGAFSYIYSGTSSYDPFLLNNDLVSVNTRYSVITIPSRSDVNNFNYSASDFKQTSRYKTYSGTGLAYVGYKWFIENPWTFTNNVYNPNQTFNVNFPDWVQQSITLLGKQIDAVNLGLQNLSKINWATTQPQIQTAAASDAAVSQAVNNWENPGNIPEPEPNPNPDPDPDPEPQPVPEPVPNDEYLGNFLLPESITTKFPFCIPFDVARCLRLFSTSAREAPRWECDLGYGSNSYHVVIDLSMFNDVADFIRPLEYILFLVGLAVGTRALIRG